jgi:galactose-1-phosphate uridylyltransferase
LINWTSEKTSEEVAMSNQITLETLPNNLKKEVIDFAEFLIQKQKKNKRPLEHPRWLATVKRGKSTGKSASATIEEMRGDERW